MARLGRFVVRAAVVGLCGLAASGRGAGVEFQVQGGAWERFRHPVALELTADQAAAAAGQVLAELPGPAGPTATSPVPFALDPSGERPVLAWLLPGITPAGALRRFALVPAPAAGAATPEAADLTCEQTDSHIVVGNSYFRVSHPRRGHGGFPDRFEFVLSGHQETRISFLDRLYRASTRQQFGAERDPQATATVRFQSPVRVVVETQSGYVGPGSTPGDPRAVYRYVYSAYSPVVEVTAVVTRDDDEPWNELHFLHPSRQDLHYTRFVVGDPAQEKPMNPPGTPSQGHGAAHWAVMATDDDALGVGCSGATCWDASGEFVYYVKAATPSWTTRRMAFAGALYVGPAVGDLSWYSRWLGPAREPEVRVTAAESAGPVGAGAGAARPTGAHELANDALRLVFADAEAGFDCLAIANRLVGDARFVHTRPAEPGLWRLELEPAAPPPPAPGAAKSAAATVTLDNRAAATRQARLEPVAGVPTLTLTWLGLDLPDEADAVDVTVTVALPAGAAASEWRIQVDNRSRRLGLGEVQFPRLSTVCDRGTADVLLPHGNWGGTLHRRNRGGFALAYPSAVCPLQFMAFNQGEAGLYLGAHDDAARPKRVVLSPEQDATFATYAEDMYVPGTHAAAPYPVVVAAYRGDWWQAARRYREWATHQAWARKGWIADRQDIPLRFKELGLWMLGGGTGAEVRPWMLEAQARFPVPVGLHWYTWHQIPFDNSYPEYFPTKPGFAETVRELVGRGQVMMPYINGRLWDKDIPSFGEGIKGAAKQRSGEPYTEVYGSGRFLAPMCPATTLWQDKVNEIVRGLIRDCGVNAIYLDQIGAAGPALCFDPSHGHPLGGGRHWVDGYRVLLDRAKAQAAEAGVALTTENTAEPYMDNIDGFLAWNPRYDTDVPMMTAVYSGYTIYFTSPQDAADDLEAFVLAQGRDFLWGCQLGWNGAWLLEDVHRAKAEFEARLCQYRLAAKAFLVYGQLLDEVRPVTPLPTVTRTWHRTDEHQATLPAVLGTLWTDRHGALAVFLVNVDSAPHVFEYTLDADRWLPAGTGAKGWLVSRLTPEAVSPWQLADPGPVGRTERLAGHEIRAVLIQPAAALDPQAVTAALAKLAAPAGAGAVTPEWEEFLFGQAMARLGLAVQVADPILTVAEGDMAEVRVRAQNRSATPRTLDVRWPDGRAEALSVAAAGTAAASHLFWPETKAGAGEVRVELAVGRGAGERWSAPVFVERVPAVSVTLGVLPRVRGGESVLLPVEVRNHSRSARHGSVELRLPDGWRVEPASRFDLGELAPGGRRDVLLKCDVPPARAAGTAQVEARYIETAASHTLAVLASRPRAVAVAWATPPQIDADLADWPAAGPIVLGPAAPGSVKIEKEYHGDADCSARVRLGWDATCLYLAAEVTDDSFHQAEAGAQLWQGDCIQLAFRNGPPNREPGFDGTEHEVGLTQAPDGPVLFQWLPGNRPLTTGKLAVVRDGTTTRYEAAVPWAALGVAAPAAGRQVSWSMTVNDNDGQGFRGWLEWTPGICGSKDSSAFGWLRFGD